MRIPSSGIPKNVRAFPASALRNTVKRLRPRNRRMASAIIVVLRSRSNATAEMIVIGIPPAKGCALTTTRLGIPQAIIHIPRLKRKRFQGMSRPGIRRSSVPRAAMVITAHTGNCSATAPQRGARLTVSTPWRVSIGEKADKSVKTSRMAVFSRTSALGRCQGCAAKIAPSHRANPSVVTADR